jgi:hypothetical protein
VASGRTEKDRRRLRRSAILAGVGDGVVATALPLLAVDLTRDPLGIAAIVAAQHLPWVVIHVGWTRLRTDRRTLVGLVDTLRSLLLGALGFQVLLGHETLLWIQITALVVGLGEALTDGTESETTDVSGLSTRAMIAMALLGMPLGGFLFDIFPAVPFLAEVLAFAAAALFVLLVGRPVRPPAPPRIEDDDEADHVGPAAGLVTLSAAVGCLAGAAAAGVLVLYAHDDLGLGAPAFGVLLAGLAGCTAVGAIAAPELGHRLGVRPALVAALLVAAAGHALASQVADPEAPWFGAMALGVTAGGAMVASVLARAALQLDAGRALTTAALRPFHLTVWTAIPLGALGGGWIARRTSVSEVFLWAAGTWLAAAVVALLRPAERRADELV